jgi:hypothetical protein
MGCGAGGGNGGASAFINSLSEAQVTDFVALIAGAGADALDVTATAKNRPEGILKNMRARILKASSARHAKVLPQQIVVQCNSDDTVCTFSDNFNVPYTCETGGSMDIAGELTGTGTPTSAYLSIGIQVSISGWTCEGPTINSTPLVDINGTYDYPADTMTMTISGGFSADGQTYMLNITVNANADGSGDISGTAGPYTINATF